MATILEAGSKAAVVTSRPGSETPGGRREGCAAALPAGPASKIVAGSKYGAVPRMEERKPKGLVTSTTTIKTPDVRVVERQISFRDWFFKEMKEGGVLAEYLRMEKGRMPMEIRKMARRMWKREQNMKSEHELKLAMPARLYMRLRQMDRDFFKDDGNIRRLIRDNPELAPWKR